MDRARGDKSRSQFIREALAEQLGMKGNVVKAPDRVGKGRKPRPVTDVTLNEVDASEDAPAAKRITYEAKKAAKKKPKSS